MKKKKKISSTCNVWEESIQSSSTSLALPPPRKSSSLPSSALEMPHFFKEQQTSSSGMLAHAFATQPQGTARFSCPVVVTSGPPLLVAALDSVFNTLGRGHQTVLIQTSPKASSIHPSSRQRTMTFFGKFSFFGGIFHLNTTQGGLAIIHCTAHYSDLHLFVASRPYLN